MNKTIFTATILCGLLPAQSPKAQAILMAVGANSKQIAAYQWKQKITVYRHGNPTAPTLEEIRFDITGQPHRVTLSKPEEKRMGPLRARKAAGIKEDVQDVMQLARRYASPQQVADVIRKGEIWEGPGALRVQSRSAVIPGDELTIAVNSNTHLPSRMDIKTHYEGAPVSIAIDYEHLAGGPSMMSRMTVQIPKDGIVVSVESFDFVRLAGTINP